MDVVLNPEDEAKTIPRLSGARRVNDKYVRRASTWQAPGDAVGMRTSRQGKKSLEMATSVSAVKAG